MENRIYIIVLFTGLICSAQNETLLEHTWNLQYIDLNGTTLYQPTNEESEEHITIGFFENSFNDDFFNFEHNLICDGFFCELLEFTDNNTFDFLSCALTLDGCNMQENADFQSNYMIIYQDFFGGGEVFSPFTYSFTTEGNIIYLTIINSLGNSATYSATILSSTEFSSFQFKIHPNPVNNNLIIQSENADIENIKIYNLSGKQVLQHKYNPNEAIDVSSLAKGLYVLKVQTEAGSITKKLVKK